jgi:hypothetical protein
MSEIYSNSKPDIAKIKHYIEKSFTCLSTEMNNVKTSKDHENINIGYNGIKEVLSESYIRGALDCDYVIDKGVKLEEAMKKYRKTHKNT